MKSTIYMRICVAFTLGFYPMNVWAMPPAPIFPDAQFCLRNQTVSHSLRLQIAKTPEQLAYGLMFRKKLAPYDGMIFQFGSPRVVQMWMKDTPLPLDMVFLDSTGKIVEINYDAVPYLETIIAPHQPISSVIELEAGRAKTLSATLGTILSDGACKPYRPSTALHSRTQ